MRKLKYIISTLFATLLLFTCVEELENNLDFVNDISSPTNVSALVSITQDNTGMVTITPTGEGVVSFTIDFGDGNTSETINPGNSVDNQYPEGTYEAVVVATGINGETAETIVTVVVSFSAPDLTCVAKRWCNTPYSESDCTSM